MSTFGRSALRLIAEGYQPIPVRPCSKIPSAGSGWPVRPNARTLGRWVKRCADHGVGLVCSQIVGIDIDVLEYDAARRLVDLVSALLGYTPLIRVGRAPKTLLVFRVLVPVPTTRTPLSVGKIEILGAGTFFVAFGIHPDTREPYKWTGDGTPFDTPLATLPLVTPLQLEDLILQALRLFPTGAAIDSHQMIPIAGIKPVKRGKSGIFLCPKSGRVLDGRDAHLASVVFGVWCTATSWKAEDLAEAAWREFAATTDLTRPARDGKRSWQRKDALKKAKALLQKARAGLLRVIAKSRGRVAKVSGENPTTEDVECFNADILDQHRRGHLPQRAWRVSEFMASRLVDGACVDAVRIIARETGMTFQTVQRARKDLLVAGLWTTARQLGNRETTAPYFPTITNSPKCLVRAGEFEAGASELIPNIPVGVGGAEDRALMTKAEADVASNAPRGLVPEPRPDDIQYKLLPPLFTEEQTREALESWTHGYMPNEGKAWHVDRRDSLGMRHRDVAGAIGISREHISNLHLNSCWFSPRDVASWKHFLMPEVFPRPADTRKGPRPHPRRHGGRRRSSSDPASPLTGLALFGCA